MRLKSLKFAVAGSRLATCRSIVASSNTSPKTMISRAARLVTPTVRPPVRGAPRRRRRARGEWRGDGRGADGGPQEGPAAHVALEVAQRAQHCHLGLLLVDLVAEHKADAPPKVRRGLHAVRQHHPRLHVAQLRRRPRRPATAAAALPKALLSRLLHRKVHHRVRQPLAAHLWRQVHRAELDGRAAPAVAQRRRDDAMHVGRRRHAGRRGRGRRR